MLPDREQTREAMQNLEEEYQKTVSHLESLIEAKYRRSDESERPLVSPAECSTGVIKLVENLENEYTMLEMSRAGLFTERGDISAALRVLRNIDGVVHREDMTRLLVQTYRTQIQRGETKKAATLAETVFGLEVLSASIFDRKDVGKLFVDEQINLFAELVR